MTTLAAYLAEVGFDEEPSENLPSCKAYVGSGDSEDARVKAWYAAAIQWCDQKLSSLDFVDSAGVSTDPPDDCVLAVYHWVRAMRDQFKRPAGIRKEKTGQREREFAGGAGHVAANVAGAEAWPLLENYIDLDVRCSGGVG